MSEEEIRRILDAIATLSGRVIAIESAVKDLREVDREHWTAIDTGAHDVKEVQDLVKTHEEELSKVRNKTALITAPAVAALVEFIRFILENT
jgi:hypothetical protein